MIRTPSKEKSKLPNHVKNYMAAFGYNQADFIPCEWCGSKSVEVHHIEPRSKFGSTTKDEQDDISNLIALCRMCHNKAHGVNSREIKLILKELVINRKS